MSAQLCNRIGRLRLRLAAEWAVRRARATTIKRCRRLPFRKLLVLCYGNIYRSPLVAAYLGHELCDANGPEIRSAGFHPTEGRPVREEYLRQVPDSTKSDLSAHRSKIVRLADVRWADSIIIMDRHNWHALAQLSADGLEKVIWLGAFLPSGSSEIVDPYGLPEPEMQRVIDRMAAATKRMADQITPGRREILQSGRVAQIEPGDDVDETR